MDGEELRIGWNYFFSRQAKSILASLQLAEVSVDDLEIAGSFALRLIGLSSRRIQPEVAFAFDGSELKNIALARLLLFCCSNRYATRLFGEGLGRLNASRLSLEKEEGFQNSVRQLYPSIAFEDGAYLLELAEFLSGPNELAYAGLQNGKVSVSKEELLSMVSRQLSSRASDFSSFDPKGIIPDLIKEYSAILVDQLPSAPAVMRGDFTGKWLGQECIKKILAGVPEGRRYYGSMALSLACQKDGLSRSEATAVLEQYVANCQRSSHAFRPGEALASLDWIYKHPGINLSCRMMVQQGLIESRCSNCPQMRGVFSVKLKQQKG